MTIGAEEAMLLPLDVLNKIKKFREDVRPIAKEKSLDLSKFIFEVFRQFENKPPYTDLNKSNKPRLELDLITLGHALFAFWDDIIRLQAYHDIDIPDRHKHAAYIFKWINKFKPIHVEGQGDDRVDQSELSKDCYMNVNAAFSFACVMGFVNCKTPCDTEYKAIMYSAICRDIPPEQWALTFYYMEKMNPLLPL